MTNRTLNTGRFVLSLAVLFAVNTRAEWVFQESHTTNSSLRAVCAISAKVVWAAGSEGTCLRPLDGGETWKALPVPGAEKLDFRGVVGFDDRTAIIMSVGEAEKGMARVYRTVDGGQTWQLVFHTEEKGVFLDGVAFWNRENGLIFGDPINKKWYLLKTTDGGRTWERVAPEVLPAMLDQEAAFAASNSSILTYGASTVWIGSGGGAKARVFVSTDRAKTWQVTNTPMPSGTTEGIFGMRFLDPRNGIAVGGDHKRDHEHTDNVIITTDGGKTWQSATASEPPGLKESVALLPGGMLLAVGPSGTCQSRNLALSWKTVDTIPFHAASSVDSACWAVGPRGSIAKWKQ